MPSAVWALVTRLKSYQIFFKTSLKTNKKRENTALARWWTIWHFQVCIVISLVYKASNPEEARNRSICWKHRYIHVHVHLLSGENKYRTSQHGNVQWTLAENVNIEISSNVRSKDQQQRRNRKTTVEKKRVL